MTDAIDVLYDYALESMLSNHLGKTLEYHRMARRSETHEAALREALGEQNLPLLEDLLKDQYHFHDRETRAMFRCALAIGLELGQL